MRARLLAMTLFAACAALATPNDATGTEPAKARRSMEPDLGRRASPRRARGRRASSAPPPAPRASTVARIAREAEPQVSARRPPRVKAVCMRTPVELERKEERVTVALETCDGSPAPFAVEHLSLMARANPASPTPVDMSALAKKSSPELAPGVRRLDVRLVERLQRVVDRFSKDGHAPPRVVLVSGYRPAAERGFHRDGRALDFRLEGVKNEDLVAFCKTLSDVGCGYYPNSPFVHMDVRDAGAGHVAWIDGSGPGEPPRYVATWPPPLEDATPAEPGTSTGDTLEPPPHAPVNEVEPMSVPDGVDAHPAAPNDEERYPIPTPPFEMIQ